MKKTMKMLILTTCISALSVIFSPIHAVTGVPTVDAFALIELKAILESGNSQLSELVRTNGILDAQTLKMLEQIKQLETIYKTLSEGVKLEDILAGLDLENLGLENFGSVQTTISAGLEGNWESLLGGKVNGQSSTKYIDRFFKTNGITKEEVATLSASKKTNEASAGNTLTTNAVASAAAEQSAANATQSMERVGTLVDKIDESENLIQAIQLNSRITAELAISLGNMWNMEAVQTIQLGQAGVADAATLAADDKFMSLVGAPAATPSN